MLHLDADAAMEVFRDWRMVGLDVANESRTALDAVGPHRR
jgi:hypothetical protein